MIFVIVDSITVATAQDSLVTLSSTELSFYGEAGYTEEIITSFYVVALEENVKIKTSSTILYDNRSGNSITISAIDLSATEMAKNTEQIVNVGLDLTKAKEGFYQGTIILTAEADKNFTSTKISVKAIIKGESTLLGTLLEIVKNDYVQIGLVLLAVFLIGLALMSVPEETKKAELFKKHLITKEKLVISTGIFAILVWALILITSSFDTLKTTLSTILIAPFILFITGYVNFKRDERKERRKVATEIRNKGIEKDLDFLRGIIGETSNHFASLQSKYYNEKGSLSRKKWDDSSTQGVIIDIPTGRLAKYYRYTELHNKHYSCILEMGLLKGKTVESWIKEQLNKPQNSDFDLEQIVRDLNTPRLALPSQVDKEKFALVCRFEQFRQTYEKLEQAIWSNLIFQIGSLGEAYLEPLEIDFPRLSRGLLLYLVEKGVLTNKSLAKLPTYPLKEKIEKLDPDLLKDLLKVIYGSDMRQKIELMVTKDFDDTYEKLEELCDLPSLPSECTKVSEKETKISLNGKIAVLKDDQARKQH